jgi:lipid II:glycine glycyltransferase (peptidoglycan interpeptide bridge formation enzyme)
MQPHWLDNVCEAGMEWDVILYEKGGEIRGSFVYVIQKKHGMTLITLPKLTQFLGPYIKYPEGQKYGKRLSWEKEVMNYFIDHLPKYDDFNMNFHHTVTNWLPFYWKGFKQTTRYTYRIDKDTKTDELSKNLETDIRRRRKKAQHSGVEVVESDDIEQFYRLNTMTFDRQGIEIPYSLEFIKNLYRKLKEKNACKIFVATHEKKAIAAAFLVYDTRSVFYLMGGLDSNRKELGGMDMVLYRSIEFALDNRLDFDFEGSMVESIEKYFRSFGAVQTPYHKVMKTRSKLWSLRNCIKDLVR